MALIQKVTQPSEMNIEVEEVVWSNGIRIVVIDQRRIYFLFFIMFFKMSKLYV